jgi:GxxExxY protein
LQEVGGVFQEFILLKRIFAEVDGREVDVSTITESVIGAAIRVHTQLGPGLLESLYEKCLVYELEKSGLKVQKQVPIEVRYDDVLMDLGFRLDILVERCLVIEVKSVEILLPLHKAQLATYLKLTKRKAGLLLNFNVLSMKDGVKRVVV